MMTRLNRRWLANVVGFASISLLAGCASHDRAIERVRALEEQYERVNVVPSSAAPKTERLAMEKAFVTNTLYFGEGSATLASREMSILDQFAAWLASEAPRSRIEIYGYTDGTGTTGENVGLARARADAVRRYLRREQHVASTRMSVIPVGEYAPVAANETPEGRAQNRRVVVIVRW